MSFDPIALLEAAYEPCAGAETWLARHAPAIASPFDADEIGVLSYFVERFESPRSLSWTATAKSTIRAEEAIAIVAGGFGYLTPEQRRRGLLATQRPGVHGFVETFGATIPRAMEHLDDYFQESLAVIIPTGGDVVAIATTMTRRRFELEPEVRALWERIAIHLGAACRLATRPATLDGPDVEAVLDWSGAVVDANSALGADARDCLGRAVRDLDRAKSRRVRRDPLAALDLWHALIAGRWSLVERVDTDGRQFVTARRNDPDPRGASRLTRRQRQVLFYASVGWSLKQMSYALGLAEGTITHHLRAALRTLGLPSRAELIRATSELALRAMGQSSSSADGAALSDAERTIAGRAAAGWSNERIAVSRGVSVRTVANQLTSIYRKLGVRDRHELVLWAATHGLL